MSPPVTHDPVLLLRESPGGSYSECEKCSAISGVALAGSPCPWCDPTRRTGKPEHISHPLSRALAGVRRKAKGEG